MNIGKYEFDTKEKAIVKIDSLGTLLDDEGNEYPSHNHTVVQLGNIVLERGTYTEEGEEITAPVLSEKYLVDVAWHGLEDHPYGWKSYSVDSSIKTGQGVHSFGVDYQTNKF